MALGLAIEDAVRDVRRRHLVPDVRWDSSKLSREQSLDAKWVPAGIARLESCYSTPRLDAKWVPAGAA